ncbi:ankyrin repeat domain-containing protein [Photobacterium halotolerans]|uniref:Uncharacterized protein n=1 Tax=Photobacterium halotolerans TaxID=265726 RepID=A0A0F5VAP4_9GAMM|nr:ankyrin repeat domain-containing protein [Photobacterium halotolerans]KKC98559.1 hypothetical protein KY46_17515 [Photobacterium halotolerans]
MSYELYEAIVDGEIETAKDLIRKGEDIHHVTANDKWTYLHKAADTDDTPPESIQFLIDQGLDVNAIDNYGYTPLIYAVRQRNVPAMRLLLENGAKETLEHRGKDSLSALRMAIKFMPLDYNVIKVLLEYGADPDAAAPNGNSVRQSLEITAGIDPAIKALFAQ